MSNLQLVPTICIPSILVLLNLLQSTRMQGLLDRMQAGLIQFHKSLGEHESKIDMLIRKP